MNSRFTGNKICQFFHTFWPMKTSFDHLVSFVSIFSIFWKIIRNRGLLFIYSVQNSISTSENRTQNFLLRKFERKKKNPYFIYDELHWKKLHWKDYLHWESWNIFSRFTVLVRWKLRSCKTKKKIRVFPKLSGEKSTCRKEYLAL